MGYTSCGWNTEYHRIHTFLPKNPRKLPWLLKIREYRYKRGFVGIIRGYEVHCACSVVHKRWEWYCFERSWIYNTRTMWVWEINQRRGWFLECIHFMSEWFGKEGFSSAVTKRLWFVGSWESWICEMTTHEYNSFEYEKNTQRNRSRFPSCKRSVTRSSI